MGNVGNTVYTRPPSKTGKKSKPQTSRQRKRTEVRKQLDYRAWGTPKREWAGVRVDTGGKKR